MKYLSIAIPCYNSQEYMDKLEGFVGRRTQAVMGLNNQRQLIMMFDESAKNYK